MAADKSADSSREETTTNSLWTLQAPLGSNVDSVKLLEHWQHQHLWFCRLKAEQLEDHPQGKLWGVNYQDYVGKRTGHHRWNGFVFLQEKALTLVCIFRQEHASNSQSCNPRICTTSKTSSTLGPVAYVLILSLAFPGLALIVKQHATHVGGGG